MADNISFSSKNPLISNQRTISLGICTACRCFQRLFERRILRYFVGLLACAVVCCIVYLSYFCPNDICSVNPSVSSSQYSSQSSKDFSHQDLLRVVDDFDVEGERDVIVFLHIQKTGGTTFGKHLVRDIQLDTPCHCIKHRKRCDCLNRKQHIWLFSRYSTGWPCGLHADWTELKNCVEGYITKEEGPGRRRYLYITFLRNPYNRYLSEWKHVQRGSTWEGAQLKCNGRHASIEEVPFCFNGEDWSGVTLDEFLACPHNLANNRQTRMLANLSIVGCYNSSVLSAEEHDRLMLESAKANLKDMTYFGLTEFQKESQVLFEDTFHLSFEEDFVQLNSTHANAVKVTEKQEVSILAVNSLDMELYNYAKELFLQRMEFMKKDLREHSTLFEESDTDHQN